jgi:3D (Asp-Asp-Asp) domain-containing protein
MRKRIFGRQGALLAAAIGVVSLGYSGSALAAQFDHTEIDDQSKLIVIAAPLGTGGGNHRLLILEQLNNRRLCWQEAGSNPTLVDPLLLEFDFTGICGRGTDSNSYSVRVAGQDLAGRYNLRIVRERNDLVLIAFSLVEKEIQSFEIGRTNGLTENFAKINLNPGWRLARRSFQGRNVGHIYLINDQSLPEVAKKPVLPQPVPTSTPSPSLIPALPSSIQPAPSKPQPTSYPISVPPPTNPKPANLQPAPITSPTPAPVNPTLTQPNLSPSGTASPSPAQNFVVPTVAPNPTNLPPATAPSFPPQTFAPVQGSPPSGILSYRVVVDASTPEQQEQVKRSLPTAFRTSFNGQRVMQVGLFRDRATAESLQQQLNLQHLPARIISTESVETLSPRPVPSAPLIASSSIPALRTLTSSATLTAFNFPEPTSASIQQNLSIWATYYTTHQAVTQPNGYPLLDPAGNTLGVLLSERDWCSAALEGSVQITNEQGGVSVYNFAGRGDRDQVNCSTYYPTLNNISATNRVRFKPSQTQYGEGVNGYQLVPYRSIAVDRTLIPIGSVIYIPEARGVAVTLPSGEQVVHDGYFYAADVGSAIKGNHIDVFLGIAKRNPFPFVKSTQSATFNAYIVNNSSLQALLLAQHRSRAFLTTLK